LSIFCPGGRNFCGTRYCNRRTYRIALAADALTGDSRPVELFKMWNAFHQVNAAVTCDLPGIKGQRRQNGIAHIAGYPGLVSKISNLSLGCRGRAAKFIKWVGDIAHGSYLGYPSGGFRTDGCVAASVRSSAGLCAST